MRKKVCFHSFFMLFILSGCGANTFKEFETENAAATAALKLEAQDPSAAIEIVLTALGENYRALYEGVTSSTNLGTLKSELTAEMYATQSSTKHIFETISVLAGAHAQLYGIDPFDVALALARSDSEETDTTTTTTTTSSGNDVTKLFPILPEASPANILGLDVAITILQSIESVNYSESDNYKEAIFLTSSVSLVTKALDLNSDGDISAEEVASLQTSSATSILNQLRAASSAMSSSDGVGNSSDTAEGAAQILAILTEIDAQEGSTDEEKLVGYLSQATTTSTN